MCVAVAVHLTPDRLFSLPACITIVVVVVVHSFGSVVVLHPFPDLRGQFSTGTPRNRQVPPIVATSYGGNIYT